VLVGSASVTGWPYYALGGRIGVALSTPSGARVDNFGGGNYVVNTPPTATITSPADTSFFIDGQSISLIGSGSDTETPPASLQYVWWVDIHHNIHVHPGSPLSTSPTATYVAHDHDDGSGVQLEAVFAVTDQGGVADSARIRLFPEVDLEPTSPTVTPATPGATTNAEYRFWIRNHGRMPSPIQRWALVAGSWTLAQGDTLVPARDSVEIVALVGPTAPAGNYTLRVRVDTLSRVVETQESNNASNVPFIIVPGGSVDVGPGVPTSLALGAARPNPSAGEVQFQLGLPQETSVRFAVYDVQGRQIWRAPERAYPPGWWPLSWSGQDENQRKVPPGLYLGRVEIGSRSLVRPVVVIH